jgi:transposase
MTWERPPSIPAEKKTRIVMSVLAGEMTMPEAARSRSGGGRPTSSRPRKAALAAGKSGLSRRAEQLDGEVADLTRALGEAAVELQVWTRSAEGRRDPSRTSR